jgi:hypothetical protein
MTTHVGLLSDKDEFPWSDDDASPLSNSTACTKILRMSSVGGRRSGEARKFLRRRNKRWRVYLMSASIASNSCSLWADTSIRQSEPPVVASANRNPVESIYGEIEWKGPLT